jgi:thioredoxin 1
MKKITSEEFDNAIKESQYVVIDFSSPGCAPCKKVPPLLDEIIGELSEINISGYEIDVTEAPDIAQKLFVLGVPTIVVYKEGKEIKRFNSVPKKDKIKKLFK